MKTFAIAAVAALLSGCGQAPAPEVKLVKVVEDAPAPVYPQECFNVGAPFPKLPVGDKGPSGGRMLDTLNKGRKLYEDAEDERATCREALKAGGAVPSERPAS